MVRDCLHFTVFIAHGIVCFRASHAGERFSVAKGNGFHGRNGKCHVRHFAFEGIKEGFAHADRKSKCHAFDLPADGVPFLLRSKDSFFHRCPLLAVNDGKAHGGKFLKEIRFFSQRVEGEIHDACDG